MSEEKHTHVHVLEDGTVIEHSHDHAHGHHHTNTKAVLNRLSRAIQISVNVNRWRMPEVSMSKTRDPSASTVFSYFKFLSGNF